MECFELVPGKVKVCFYGGEFDHSTHLYNAPEETARNLDAVSRYHGVKTVRIAKQVHGGTTVPVEWDDAQIRPEADGLYTWHKGMGLGVLTADCVPVLVTSASGDLIGVAHCGWRGVIHGIIPSVLHAMSVFTDDELVAAIGPSIQQASYEVGQEVREAFLRHNMELETCFEARDGKYGLDLPGCVELELAKYDVPVVMRHENDTYADTDRYFSHRRGCKEGRNEQRRMLSVVSML